MPIFRALFGYFPRFCGKIVHFFSKKFVCDGVNLYFCIIILKVQSTR